jgi:hypothetical protein
VCMPCKVNMRKCHSNLRAAKLAIMRNGGKVPTKPAAPLVLVKRDERLDWYTE